MKTNFMQGVYENLFGYRGRTTIDVAEYAEAYGLEGDAEALAAQVANRVKASLSMIATTKDDDNAIVHRPFTFGAADSGKAFCAHWKGDHQALVVDLVAAPVLFDEDTQVGKIPTGIIGKATNRGQRKLHSLMIEAVTDAVAAAPEDYFADSVNRLARMNELCGFEVEEDQS